MVVDSEAMEVFFLVLGKKYQGWVVTGEQEEVHQDLPCGAVPSSKGVDVLKAACLLYTSDAADD